MTPLRWLAVVAAYGEGYRSPQARQLAEGEEAPFAKVRAGEVGLRLRAWDDRLVATAAAFATFLAADLAFDPGAGRLEKIGPTSRLGVAGQVVARPWPFLLASLSLTWVRATLDAPPPATAENPAPPYTPGQLLPYVPPIVLRGDASAQGRLFSIRGLPVEGRAGVGCSLLSPRPLPFGKSAAAVYLLDASVGARLRWVELGLEVQNLLDLRYAATEYSFVSDWNTRAVPSLLPARHLSAGAPRTFLGTLALHF